MTQWDDMDEYDRAWALALHRADRALEAKAAAEKCPSCGGPKSECQDPDNQHAFVPDLTRCYRTRAVQDAQKKRSNDPDLGSLLISTRIDPARKKSAGRKG